MNLYVFSFVQSVETRPVRHFQYTSWPVSGVPKSTQEVTNFLMDVKMADSSGPAVVHCSAGIGRTGVLIAIDIGLQAVLQGDTTIDVLRFVSTIRQDRPGAVQTREQYKFIHQVRRRPYWHSSNTHTHTQYAHMHTAHTHTHTHTHAHTSILYCSCHLQALYNVAEEMGV